MNNTSVPEKLQNDATIAIVGGGPAGSFQAIHLLNQARLHDQKIQVVLFEYRRQIHDQQQGDSPQSYSGCPKCAGGISPRLNDALADLGINIPDDHVQARINSITLQGNWKHIYLSVPQSRRMLSVYRGVLPCLRDTEHHSFDSLLLDAAMGRGATLIGSRVHAACYNPQGKPVLTYNANGTERKMTADCVIFAGGVNERSDERGDRPASTYLFRTLQPDYRPPKLRKAIIFELKAPPGISDVLAGEMHFIESSVDPLKLDMCSIIPKRHYFTVTLIGKSVDKAATHKQNLKVIYDFLALPQIRRTLPPTMELCIQCVCNPYIVVGPAKMPYGHRIAATGDMATSRQYKDGILSAHNITRDLAGVIFEDGVDSYSLKNGYGKILAQFRRDNYFATVIFSLYRWFFNSPFLSRVIYQTYTSERKKTPQPRRSFEKIFWNISSGDDSYERIAWSMLRPNTLWKILSGGVYVTARNWLAERFFGLNWSGIGRFSTVVSREGLEEKRSRLIGGRQHEFECMYTIHLRTDSDDVLSLLAEFGEAGRPYLNPRWVRIQRASGVPLHPGCVVEYNIFGGLISFSIEQTYTTDDHLILYDVRNGFAHGGRFLFEVEQRDTGHCLLTVYLTFNYARGTSIVSRLYWWIFRFLFPEFIHEVIWNHALCEFKQTAEKVDLEQRPEIIAHMQV